MTSNDLQEFAAISRGLAARITFTPLPLEQHRHSTDDRCACVYCSPTMQSSEHVPTGIWDTLATDTATGATWLVHYPELHHRPARR